MDNCGWGPCSETPPPGGLEHRLFWPPLAWHCLGVKTLRSGVSGLEGNVISTERWGPGHGCVTVTALAGETPGRSLPLAKTWFSRLNPRSPVVLLQPPLLPAERGHSACPTEASTLAVLLAPCPGLSSNVISSERPAWPPPHPSGSLWSHAFCTASFPSQGPSPPYTRSPRAAPCLTEP